MKKKKQKMWTMKNCYMLFFTSIINPSCSIESLVNASMWREDETEAVETVDGSNGNQFANIERN